MTFNVQLMTRMLSKGKFDLGELFADPFEYRLDRLQKAVASEPVPDLLVLNEVFSEEARGRLLTMLSPYFAYIEPSFGPTDVFDLITNLGKIDDGGLMLCSQWPFQVVKFAAFAESAGWDSVANKGFAVVTVEAQPHGIAVVLTHLQADEANAHVRLLQLQQIRDTLTDPALANVISEFPVILCGDLNVIGNPPRPEWEGVFDEPPLGGPFLDLFTDGWNSHMPRADPGLTTASGRLDYILLNHSPVGDLVTQHMRIRHRGVSDHFAVLADVNVKSDSCTPTSARVVQQVHPQWCGAEALAFAYPGSMQWCRIDSPGTYVFTKPPNHALRIFEATNISEPLPDFDRRAVDLQELPGSQAAWQEMDLPPVGRKFHLPNAPFYVQLTNPADAAQPTRFGWVRCQGTSPYDAVVLQSHQAPDPFTWPATSRAGDEAWFEAYVCRSVDNQRHTSTFYVDNPSRGALKLRIKDANQVVLAETDWTDGAHIDLPFEDVGGRPIYFTVERRTDATRMVQVGWRTALTFLLGARESTGQDTHKLGLFCVDETSVDWWGDDEIVLKLFLSGREISKFPADRPHWDADSDDLEYFPMRPIPFLDGLQFEVRELEDVVSDDVGRAVIDPLPDLDQGDDPNSPVTGRRLRVSVGSGTYELWCNLARNAVGGSPTGSA